jgi:photosystem II stability/assembly factor-like uncharacterized protein
MRWAAIGVSLIFCAGALADASLPSDRRGTATGKPRYDGVWGSSGRDLYVVGGQGTILHSSNGGATWKPQASGTTAHLHDVWGSGPNDVYAVGDAGTILHTADRGRTWRKIETGVPVTLNDCWGSSANDVYAVGAAGFILHSTDGGATFRLQRVPVRVDNIAHVHGSGPDDVYVATSSAGVFHSVDRGETWRRFGVPNGAEAVWARNPNEVWIAGHRGYVVRSTDGGATFQYYRTGILSDLNGIAPAGPDSVVVVGTEGAILRFEPEGARDKWRDESLTPSPLLVDVFTTDDKLFVVGDGALLLQRHL